jgi:peptidoglycan-associated lipoprotein
MTTRSLFLLTLLAFAAACNPPAPEEVIPQPDTTATRPVADPDSARRAADEAARRRADSLAAAARDSAARAEAARNAAMAAGRAEAERLLANLIHFEYDRADIRPEDQGVLDWKARLLQANPTMTIRISGHADERGSDEYNLALSNRRAAAAKRYLVNKGIAESRISIDAYGEERPLDTGSTEEAWARNRRDEFLIVVSPATWTLPTP